MRITNYILSNNYCRIILLCSISVLGIGMAAGGAFSWFTRDDKAYWEAQVPIIANKDLTNFETASKGQDTPTLRSLVGALETTIKSAHDNNQILLPRISYIVNKLNGFANSNLNVFQRAGLYSLVRLVDGVRDNKSYYTLDAAREWISLRLPVVTDGTLKEELTDARTRTVDARDFLDDHAQIFVQGIKDLVQLTSKDTLSHSEQIKGVTNKMVDSLKDINVLNTKTLDLISVVHKITLGLNRLVK